MGYQLFKTGSVYRIVLPVVLVLSWGAPGPAGANPYDRFEEGIQDCPDGECNICGAKYSCPHGTGHQETEDCSWGAIKFNRAQTNEAQEKGLLIYCMGSGGVMLSTPSAMGVQSQTLSHVLTTLYRRGPRTSTRTIGGVLEYNRIGGKADSDIFGTTIPLSWSFVFNDWSDIMAQGNVIVGIGDGIYQYGFNVNPVFTAFLLGREDEDAWRLVAGASLPLQFVATSGDDIAFGASWLVGAGGFVGVSRRLGSGAIGAGATLDFRYMEGVTVPMHIALRSSHDLSDIHRWLGSLVIQPGLYMDFAAGGGIGDTITMSMLVGMELKDFVIGYQAMFQGSNSSHGFGVTYVSKVGELAAGSGAHKRTTDDEKKDAPASAPAKPVAKPKPPVTPAPGKKDTPLAKPKKQPVDKPSDRHKDKPKDRSKDKKQKEPTKSDRATGELPLKKPAEETGQPKEQPAGKPEQKQPPVKAPGPKGTGPQADGPKAAPAGPAPAGSLPSTADKDGDGVPDSKDACPGAAEDKDGFEDADGCPDPDNDKDGVEDTRDRCPLEPEDLDGDLDDDGCPDLYKLINVTRIRVELKQKLRFARNRLKRRSFPVLDEVAGFLTKQRGMHLRIEGHTCSRRSRRFNRRRSTRRARAVMKYLVRKGIDASRMTAIGIGEAKPIDSNRTAAGRATNERIEIHLTGQAAKDGGP